MTDPHAMGFGELCSYQAQETPNLTSEQAKRQAWISTKCDHIPGRCCLGAAAQSLGGLGIKDLVPPKPIRGDGILSERHLGGSNSRFNLLGRDRGPWDSRCLILHNLNPRPPGPPS